MGEVWLAEQNHPVRRRVALKLIKAGMNTREIVLRFESERQALALMDHPAIAKVFDAGSTPDGVPYFVMEFVAGLPITEYCDKHRLSVDERLQLFIQVCEAVQHAHQKAIIHRDLKPSNVLVAQVDGKAVPKVIDFGLAKATAQRLTAETMFTRIGTMIGTPAYMSPEQADSGGEDIDTRTDVYSLGVILYELLVGALPLDLTEIRNIAVLEVLRRIREDDAPRPSTKLRTSGEHSSAAARNRGLAPIELGRRLKGDLDSIALKALEKDRSHRYSSAADLSSDIKRYLHSEPVLAVAPSFAYRARKFARRHRFGVVISAVAGVAIVVLIASLVIGSVRVKRERDRANREAQAAQRVSDFLVQAFRISDPDESRGNKITAREVLDQGARRIETDLAGQPYVQARLMYTIADVYEGLGVYEPAKRMLENAVRLQRQVVGADARETLASQRLLARTLEYQADYGKAERLYLETLQKQERALGPHDVETLRTKGNLGNLYYEQGRYSDAEKLLTQAVIDDERSLGRDAPETLRALHNLAASYDGAKDYAREQKIWEELYERRLKKLGPDHSDTLASMQNLAYVYYRRGNYANAEKLQRQGLEIGERVLGKDHPSFLLAVGNLANTLSREGKTKEAEQLQRQVLDSRRRVLGPKHPETQFAIENLAIILSDQKRYREAETLFRQALQGEIEALGENHPEIGEAWYGVAGVEAVQGKKAAALADLNKAVDHGYNDRDEIGNDSNWNGLRNDAGYQRAVARMATQQSKR